MIVNVSDVFDKGQTRTEDDLMFAHVEFETEKNEYGET